MFPAPEVAPYSLLPIKRSSTKICASSWYWLSAYLGHLVPVYRTPCTSYLYMEYHIYEHGIPHIGTCHSKVSHEVQLQVQVINSQVIDFQLYCWKCRKIHSFGYVFITVPSFPFRHLCHDVFLLLFFRVNSIPI